MECWEVYTLMFEGCSMEVYETVGTVWVEDQAPSVSGRNNDALRLRERMERLQQKVYAIHEAIDKMQVDESTCNETIEEWIGYVEGTLDILEHVPNIEIARRNQPWEL